MISSSVKSSLESLKNNIIQTNQDLNSSTNSLDVKITQLQALLAQTTIELESAIATTTSNLETSIATTATNLETSIATTATESQLALDGTSNSIEQSITIFTNCFSNC